MVSDARTLSVRQTPSSPASPRRHNSAVVRSSRQHSPPLRAIVLVAALYAAASAQPFPSFFLDTARYIGPDVSVRYARSGFGDTEGFLAWVATDDGLVIGARATLSVELIDTIPVNLSGLDRTADGTQGVDVAASSLGFATAWQDRTDLICTLVDLDGTVAAIVPIDQHVYEKTGFAVASDSNYYVAVWCYADWDVSRVEFSEVTQAGQRIRSGVLASLTGVPYPVINDVALAHGSGRYMVVWTKWTGGDSTGSVCARLFVTDSFPGDTLGFTVANAIGPVEPAVSFDGTNFVVVWSERQPAGDPMIRVCRVTPGGLVLDTAGIAVSSHDGGQFDVASVRDTTAVVWRQAWDTTDIFLRRMDAHGDWLDSAGIEFTGSSVRTTDPSLARTPHGWLATWSQVLDSTSSRMDWTAKGRRISAGGRPLDTVAFTIAHAANAQDDGDVASDGTTFMAVWRDLRVNTSASYRVRGRRFDAAGRVLGPDAFDVSPPSAGVQRPAVGYGAGCYLVGWVEDRPGQESRDAWAARVAQDGVLLDTTPIPIEVETGLVARDLNVLFADSVFVVVFSGGGWPAGLGVVRVAPSGAVLDSPPSSVLVPVASAKSPVAATDGEYSLVAYYDPLFEKFWAARFDPEVRVIDTLELLPVAHAMVPLTAAAYGEDHYLVVLGGAQIAWLVSGSGEVEDSVRLFSPSRIGSSFDATYAQGYFLVVGAARRRDVHALRIGPNAQLLDSAPFSIASVADAYVDGKCALAATSTGDMALTLSTYEPSEYASTRARACAFREIRGIASSVAASRKTIGVSPSLVTDVVALQLMLQFPGPVRVELCDVAGRVACRAEYPRLAAGSQALNLDVSNCAPGVYFVRVAPLRGSVKVVVAR